MKRVTWIHLSDLHMEADDQFNRTVVLSSLWKDIAHLREQGLQPDFIAFTGDVAYRGLRAEYGRAGTEFFDPLLRASGIKKERLFVVPGNHDVNRRTTAMLTNPLSSSATADDIGNLVEDTEKRKLILSPLAHYEAFLDNYLPTSEMPLFGYLKTIESGNRSISIVGINSAWLSGFHRDTDGTVDDSQHLAVSEFQLRNQLSSAKGTIIVLMHHPTDWLREPDRLVVERLLAEHHAIVLRGHLHRPDILSTTSLAGELVCIPAGAIFDGRKGPNAYNVVQLDLDTGAGTIFFRRYNDRRTEWQKDLESTGDKLDGQVRFEIHDGSSSRASSARRSFLDVDIRDYDCTFTDMCRANLIRLGLNEESLLMLVQAEFLNHVNYFLFDLEDYPLPLGTQYILFLEKIGRRVEFRHIVTCTRNQAQLTSWTSILALYRRATRMSYRQDGTQLAFLQGAARRVCDLHSELLQRLRKYFEVFEGLPPVRPEDSQEVDGPPALGIDPHEVYLHLVEAAHSLGDVKQVLESIELGDIHPNNAVGLLVTSLERSLQHIHKLILRYPPQERAVKSSAHGS